ncbi:ABC transporter substrate-binding protein [Chromobacterium amazonense]|uniref:Putrescine-binding periplasmic protein n=1 Tax=Chromobacterium amazonense TaxID=1382803 RepID=A0ABU8V094_9NEIS|nr:spermidine/putrescine ABC transporter substrate-binding protein [Chromobacterium amazonense]MDE1713109.1 spermidine/putrescine ABC transporter substrate-binding protein [Chromobacterium amazonense]MDQ4539612.1 spermidine/putrescine ABC transporter substrate-binding protein [Chromobacterium amazonense]
MKKLQKLMLALGLSTSLAYAGPNDVLHIYNWSGSLSDNIVKQFEQSCGCKVVQDYYGDNEEMLAKLAAGAKGYDMVFPSSFVVQAMTKQKLLQPLDHRQIPNLKNVAPAYLSPSYDPGNRYTIPTVLSLTSVGYNVEKLQQLGIDPTSWSVIFDPKVLQKLKGKVTVLDSSREVFAAALFYLGKDPNKATEADMRAARDVIKRAKPYWAAFSNASYLKQLAIGNIWVALGYSTEFFQASEDARLSKRRFHIGNVSQREGNELGVDTMAITASAKRPDLAHQFINFMLDGKHAAQLTNLNGATNPVSTAGAFFRADLKAHPVINPTPEQAGKWTVLRELTPAERRVLARMWTEVKVSR